MLAAIVAALASALVAPWAGAATGQKRWACSVKSFRVLFSPDAELAGVLDTRSAGLVGTRAGEEVDARCKPVKPRTVTGTGAKTSNASGVLSCKVPGTIHVTVSPIRRGGSVVGTRLAVTVGTSAAPVATADVYKPRKGKSVATWSGKRCTIVAGLGPPLDPEDDG
jgi:hypothetical protein